MSLYRYIFLDDILCFGIYKVNLSMVTKKQLAKCYIYSHIYMYSRSLFDKLSARYLLHVYLLYT